METHINQKKGDIMQDTSITNPLADLISDDIYQLLQSRNLINEKSVRDYEIKKKFKHLRDQKISASDAIERIREEYPYLQFDSIRKIIYLGNKI